VRTSRTAAVLKRAVFAPLLLALLLVVSADGCKKKYVAPVMVPPTADEIKEMIATVSAKKREQGMLGDVRGAAARRLGDAGPAAKEAIPALEKLAKDKTADENVKKLAEEALAKIKGS